MELENNLTEEPKLDVKPQDFHSLFSSPDGDVIITGKDAQLFFRVHSVVLKTASGFFRTMFSLPQKVSDPQPIPIYLDEDADTIECFLRMICGLPLVPINTWDLVDSLLDAIEKYDMPGPLSIVRLLVMTPQLLNSPFRLYAVACRFGWEAEAKYASTQTLTYNLFDPQIQYHLRRTSTPALLSLLDLHHSRREGLRQRLDLPPFVSGGVSHCVNCRTLIDYHTWRELKYKIVLEMDVRPMGDTVLDPGLSDWAEAQACWLAKCPNHDCARSLYDKGETMRVIKDCIDKLPNTADLQIHE